MRCGALKVTSSDALDFAACLLYGRAFASGLITEGVMRAWPLVRLGGNLGGRSRLFSSRGFPCLSLDSKLDESVM